jgi:hypothetical protein
MLQRIRCFFQVINCVYEYISFRFGDFFATVCMYVVDKILYYFVTFFNVKLLN